MIEDIKAWLKPPAFALNHPDSEEARAKAEHAEQARRKAVAERQIMLARARADFDAGTGERALRLIYRDEICDEILSDHNRSLILSKIIAEISAEYVQALTRHQGQAERHEQNNANSLALEAAVVASYVAFQETRDRMLPVGKLWPWTNREFISHGLRGDLVAAGALVLLAIENLDLE